MSNHLAALLIAIVVCIFCPVRASAQEAACIDITESPQYSLEVLCDLPQSGDLQIEISYRGELPSVAFITPDGVQCEVNRMHWSFYDNRISVSIPNANAGRWHVKTLAEDADRVKIVCNKAIVGEDKTRNRAIIVVCSLVMLIGCMFGLFLLRRRRQIHFDEE